MLNRPLGTMLGLVTGITLLVVPTWAPAQAKTNVEALMRYSATAEARAKKDKSDALALAKILGIPIKQILPNGRHRELMRFIGTIPIYCETLNLQAAETVGTSKLWPGGVSGLNLTASDVILGEWDEGSALSTHQEFGGRALNLDSVPSATHSTHVGGTMIAAGVDPNAHGMSFMATLHSHDWNSDDSEMAAEAAQGLVLSNHSYEFLGVYGYDLTSVGRDTIAYNAPYYLICQAAGNDGPSYQTIVVPAHAKDVLTVGAVVKNPSGYSGPSSVVIADFSSRGPCYDGRIKPDIVAPGVDLYSCYDDSNTSYGYMSGTSMATPCTTGSCGLIVSYYRQLNSGHDMLSSTLKGLVINTADEAGPADGPDYNFGWGQLDTYSACLVISDAQNNPSEIQELALGPGQDTFTMTVDADGILPIKATLCWTDPPGPEEDTNTTPVLVNDLDLRVTNGGTTYMPWVLDPLHPDNPATTGDNKVDNVEEVQLQPVAGPTTITVSHKGTLQGGTQPFSLIVTGVSSAHMTGLSVAPGAIASKQTAVGTITLNLPASSVGATVKVANSNKLACKVPTIVKIPPQQSSGTFPIVANSVSQITTTTITATYGSAQFTADLTIGPSWLVGFTLNPTQVMGGNSTTGTVTLGVPAGPGGATVTVSSDNTAVAQVPNWRVVIPEGQTDATFPVTTSPIISTQTVHIMAAYPGPTLTCALTVTPYTGVSAVTLAPSSVIGGGGAMGTVTLSQAAPGGGATVQLSSDNGDATVPATVVVPAGKKTATFSIQTVLVSQPETADISASYQGGMRSSVLALLPLPAGAMSLALTPNSVQGGGTATGTVTLHGPAGPGGLVVKLQSNKNGVSLPKSVTIPAGAVTVSFTIKTSVVAATTNATITATSPGKSATATLQIVH